jgi:hypothetical protein
MKKNKIHSDLIIVFIIFSILIIIILFFLINYTNDNTTPYNIKFIINFSLLISTLVNIIISLNWKFVYYDSNYIYYHSIYSKKTNVIKKTDIVSLTNLFAFNDYMNYRIRYKNISGEIKSIVFLSLKSKKEILSLLS